MVGLALLIPFAAAMVVAIVVVLAYTSRVRTEVGLFFLYFAFIMMITMLVGASVYFLSPGQSYVGSGGGDQYGSHGGGVNLLLLHSRIPDKEG